MKKFLTGLLFAALITGCTKQSDVTSTTPSQQIVLKNPNISVVNVSARQTGAKQVTFKFSTEYEKDIASIELLNGADETLFCRVDIKYTDANSAQLKSYTFIDDAPKGAVSHYMIKYTTVTGAWYCSGIYKVVMQ